MSLRQASSFRRKQGSQSRGVVKRRGAYSRYSRGATQKRSLYYRPRYGLSVGYPTISGDRYRTTHKYSVGLLVTLVSGVSSPYVFRGNSIYDPDYTSTGYSALGYATMASLYGTYTVTGSRIRVRVASTFLDPTQVSLLPCLVSSTISSDSGDYASNAYGKDVLVMDSVVKEMDHYMSTSKLFGEALLSPQFSSNTGSNPASPWYWQLKCTPAGGAASNGSVSILVDITYYVEWSRRSAFATRA